MRFKVGDRGMTAGGWEYVVVKENPPSLGRDTMIEVEHQHGPVIMHDIYGRAGNRYAYQLLASIKPIMKASAPTDLRSPIAKVLATFMASPEGQDLTHGSASGEYLRNRIEAAFLAGARDGSRLFSEQVIGLLGSHVHGISKPGERP